MDLSRVWGEKFRRIDQKIKWLSGVVQILSIYIEKDEQFSLYPIIAEVKKWTLS